MNGFVRHVLNLGVFLVCLALAACGGGGGSSPPPVPAPSGLTYPSPQSIRINTPMTALTPTVTGTVTHYAVTPALPAGLTLNPNTGQISGTPTASVAPTNYTITATNSSGSTTFSLSLKVYAMDVEGAPILRVMAESAPISPEVVLWPRHLETGTLFASVNDANGLFMQPVTILANSNGSFTARFTLNPSISAAAYTGNLTLNLCRNATCTQLQDVPSVTIPYTVNVMAPSTAWPGNNLSALSVWPGAPEWTTVQGNASHDGFVPVDVDPNRFTLRWKIPGNSVRATFGSSKPNLVTWNGMFFVTDSQYLQGGVVFAKREYDGSEVWQFKVDGIRYPVVNPAAVGNGVVYFAAGHQDETYLYARKAADGSAVFRASMSSQWEDFHAPTVGPNGMIYANAGTYGGLYGFNPDGNRLFFSYQAQVTNWTPAVTNTGVYAYTGDTLRLADPLTGIPSVAISDPSHQNYIYDLGGAPVLGDAALGSVFGASYSNSLLNGGMIGNTLSNFRTNTGTIAWQVHGVYPTTPAYRSGRVYIVNNNPLRLEVRAESDGTLQWWWAPESASEGNFVSEVLLTNTHAFVSTSYATHAIDLTSRRSVWSYPAAGKLALSPSGVLFIHNSDSLVAVNLK